MALTDTDGFCLPEYNSARPFSSFLPGIAGEYGKPLWVFYTNRGQCISSFGVGNKNGAMLEFHPANKAYVLTSLLGFRTFLKISSAIGENCYEPFQLGTQPGIEQRMMIRAESLEIEDTGNLPDFRGLRRAGVVGDAIDSTDELAAVGFGPSYGEPRHAPTVNSYNCGKTSA